MDLKSFCENLPAEDQLSLSVKMARRAFPIWQRYALENDLSYQDSQDNNRSVSGNLLQRALEASEFLLLENNLKQEHAWNKIYVLCDEFQEPVLALYEGTIEFPYSVEKVFYAVYNILSGIVHRNVTSFGDSYFYISVNQSVEALLQEKEITPGDIIKILREYREEI